MLKNLFITNATKVVDLSRKDFEGNSKILNKYFRYNNHDLDRFHLPEISEEDYVKFVNNNRVKNENNRKLDTASDYYKSKAQIYIAEQDLGLNLDFTDYSNDEELFEYTSFLVNETYREDNYRDTEDNSRYLDMYEVYINKDPRKHNVDINLYEALYDFCINIIQRRLAMLFNIDKCLNLLLNINNYSSGFSENITKEQCDALENMFKHYKNLMSRKSVDSIEFMNFIENNNDISVYAESEDTFKDYITYYQRLLKNISGIRDSSLDYMRDIIHNELDVYEDIIIANDMDFEYEEYQSNLDYENELVLA